jgi:DnaJ-class molecular chaperone
MDKYINYYAILGINKRATPKEVKLAYYKISKEAHPDKGGDEDVFKKVTEAYKILSSDKDRTEYDVKSKFGSNYDEFSEIFDFEFKTDAKNYDKDKYEEFIKRDQLNILVYIDDSFDGNIEYERWVYCKDCNGSGKDNKAKVNMGSSVSESYYFDTEEEAKDFINNEGDKITMPIMEKISSISLLIMLNKLRDSGNIIDYDYEEQKARYEKQDNFISLKVKRKPKVNFFDLSDDCEFCDGCGKWGDEVDCFYCSGSGKINSSKCPSCNGDKRILGKQKLSSIKMSKEDKDHKIEYMGNVSRDIPNKYGHVWLIRK